MREHAHLPAVVGFMRNHVAQHLWSSRPGPSPSVPAKLPDAAFAITKRCGNHLPALSGALGQRRTSLPRRATRAVELCWNSQVRRRKPDPLRAHIVHVREDGRDRADLAGRLSFPGGRIKIPDKNLVQAIIGGKDPDCAPSEFRVDLAFVRGHRFVLLEVRFSQAAR